MKNDKQGLTEIWSIKMIDWVLVGEADTNPRPLKYSDVWKQKQVGMDQKMS